MKKRGNKAPIVGLSLLLLVLLIVFLVARRSRPHYRTLLPAVPYTCEEKGQGAFFYFEYAPLFFEEAVPETEKISIDQRFRPYTKLGNLSDQSLSRARDLLSQLEAEDGHEKKEDGLEKNPDLSDYTLSFSVRPITEAHSYPLLGDHARVLDPYRSDRAMEKNYLRRMIDQKALLSGPFGRIRKEVDGLEELFQPALLFSLEPGDLNIKNARVFSLRPGLKWVEDRLFYLALDLPARLVERPLVPGETYPLLIEEKTRLMGDLDRLVTRPDGRSLAIFSLRTGFDQLSGQRFVSAQVIEKEQDAFQLPLDAVESDGEGRYFCYRLDRANRAQKVAVQLLGKKDDIFYVAAQQSDPKQKSLQAFDRILLPAKKVAEGKTY